MLFRKTNTWKDWFQGRIVMLIVLLLLRKSTWNSQTRWGLPSNVGKDLSIMFLSTQIIILLMIGQNNRPRLSLIFLKNGDPDGLKYPNKSKESNYTSKLRSENCVKNRFYGSLRKALRKMNRASKSLVKKFKKEVKY